jgi:hypothetical protein
VNESANILVNNVSQFPESKSDDNWAIIFHEFLVSGMSLPFPANAGSFDDPAWYASGSNAPDGASELCPNLTLERPCLSSCP